MRKIQQQKAFSRFIKGFAISWVFCWNGRQFRKAFPSFLKSSKRILKRTNSKYKNREIFQLASCRSFHTAIWILRVTKSCQRLLHKGFVNLGICLLPLTMFSWYSIRTHFTRVQIGAVQVQLRQQLQTQIENYIDCASDSPVFLVPKRRQKCSKIGTGKFYGEYRAVLNSTAGIDVQKWLSSPPAKGDVSEVSNDHRSILDTSLLDKQISRIQVEYFCNLNMFSRVYCRLTPMKDTKCCDIACTSRKHVRLSL